MKILFKVYLIFPKKDFMSVKKKKSRLTTKKYVYFKQPKFYFINQWQLPEDALGNLS